MTHPSTITAGGSPARSTRRGPALETARSLLSSRRTRDALIGLAVVLAFVVTRDSMPLFRTMAREQPDGSVEFLEVAVTVAWVVASLFVALGAVIASVAAGGVASVVLRVAQRATADDVRPTSIGVSVVVAASFVVRLLHALLVDGPDDELAGMSVFAVDLGVLVTLVLVATVLRLGSQGSWRTTLVSTAGVAAVLAVFLSWGGLW